jgi:hypothetical protein
MSAPFIVYEYRNPNSTLRRTHKYKGMLWAVKMFKHLRLQRIKAELLRYEGPGYHPLKVCECDLRPGTSCIFCNKGGAA